MQDNHSRSAKGVLRGLHYQVAPHAQGKLVRVIGGRGLRRRGRHPARQRDLRPLGRPGADADNHRQLWIPPGFAHGFLVLSESADFLYKTTDYYTPEAELALRWDDPALAIAWPDIGVPYVLSAKDRAAPGLDELTGQLPKL